MDTYIDCAYIRPKIEAAGCDRAPDAHQVDVADIDREQKPHVHAAAARPLDVAGLDAGSRPRPVHGTMSHAR